MRWLRQLIHQVGTQPLARMAVGIHGQRDAGVAELLTDVLDGRMQLIEQDGGIAVPEVMDAGGSESRQGTDALVDVIDPGWGPGTP